MEEKNIRNDKQGCTGTVEKLQGCVSHFIIFNLPKWCLSGGAISVEVTIGGPSVVWAMVGGCVTGTVGRTVGASVGGRVGGSVGGFVGVSSENKVTVEYLFNGKKFGII
jgi:hypothetical protein